MSIQVPEKRNSLEQNESILEQNGSIFLQQPQQPIQAQPKRRRHVFIKEDDDYIKMCVNNGNTNWKQIANDLSNTLGQNITPRAVKERWQNYLSGNNTVPFTLEEKITLLEKYKQYGGDFKKIRESFLGRSWYNLRDEFYTITHKENKDESVDQILSDLKKERINASNLPQGIPIVPALPLQNMYGPNSATGTAANNTNIKLTVSL